MTLECEFDLEGQPTHFHRINGARVLYYYTDFIHTYTHFKGSTGYTTVLIINFHRDQDIIWSEYNGSEYENILSFIGSAEDDQGMTHTV